MIIPGTEVEGSDRKSIGLHLGQRRRISGSATHLLYGLGANSLIYNIVVLSTLQLKIVKQMRDCDDNY